MISFFLYLIKILVNSEKDNKFLSDWLLENFPFSEKDEAKDENRVLFTTQNNNNSPKKKEINTTTNSLRLSTIFLFLKSLFINTCTS